MQHSASLSWFRRLCASWFVLASGACSTSPNPGLYRCVVDENCPRNMRCDTQQLSCVNDDSAAGTSAGASTQPGMIDSSGNGGSGAISVGGASCMSARDCGLTTNCTQVGCEAGRCMRSFVAEGTALLEGQQVKGDCRTFVCDGSGGQIASADDTDAPAGDGNACHRVSCQVGEPVIANASDGSICNDVGACGAGSCSACKAGVDCTRPGECTVHLTQCNANNVSTCVDMGTALDGKVCEAGQICKGGSCGGGGACIEGAACPPDASGQQRVCNAGLCVLTCTTGECGNLTDPCRAGASADGTVCAADSVCHSSACVKTALVNGDFHDGLRGWSTTGDGMRFVVAIDSLTGRTHVSTYTSEGPFGVAGEFATGSIFQTFVVPNDAIAVRFWVFGGNYDAYVRLRGAGDAELYKATGRGGNALHVPVSWDLKPYRGQTLKLAIEDDAGTTPLYGFVNVNGFDIVREGQEALQNSQLNAGFSGWQLTGDARFFVVFEDANYSELVNANWVTDPSYGSRQSISTFVRDPASPNLESSATGTLTQTFTVPPDATALRFNIHGGKVGRVSLSDNDVPVYTATGADTNDPKTPVSWNLAPHRGKALTLTIEDAANSGALGFVGVSGFDLITGYNGP